MSVAAEDDPPLTGTRVVDLSGLIPGPAATEHLAYLGASVVKVEPPGGDPARTLYDGLFFDLLNRGKKSVVLDLKDARARRAAQALCSDADVVVESYRPGVAARLGVGYSDVCEDNPGVVYCSITGYGQDSPRPGHDLSFMARSGALTVPASWSARARPPMRPSLPAADMGAAATAVQAVLAALLTRQRTGHGRHLDIAMHEVVLHWMAPRVGRAVLGEDPGDLTRYLDPANDLYQTADDRWLAIAAIEVRLWARLCELLGDDVELPPAAEEWDWRQRRAAGDRLASALRAAFGRRSLRTWLGRLEDAGVPADPVATPTEAFTDPWVHRRGLVQDGWVRPPLPDGQSLPPAPELDADGPALRAAFGS